jgi:hypothetical protein
MHNHSRLFLYPGLYAITTYPRNEAFAMPKVELDEFISVTYEPEHILLICPQGKAMEGGHVSGSDWRVLQIRGAFDAQAENPLRQVTQVLEGAAVPVMVSREFETDFLLMRDTVKDQAIQALSAQGYDVDTQARKIAV